MSLLVSGSLAYDFIMDFPDSFRHHILPDNIHILNVCFVVEKLSRHFGGTAGNIAYTMKLLGENPLIVAPLGRDGREYHEYFRDKGIATTYIAEVTENLTASAHITTDKDNNQITAFYNGPLGFCIPLPLEETKPRLVIIAPTHKDVMIAHARACRESGVPYVFDPGQQLGAFSAQELMEMIGNSEFLIGNDYELKLLAQKTGWETDSLREHVPVVIITLGEKGSLVLSKDQKFEISPCSPVSVEDPTGAGDAYRAGFFTAYAAGHDYETCGQVGSVAASYAIEHYGTQNHAFTPEEFTARYEETYKKTMSLSM